MTQKLRDIGAAFRLYGDYVSSEPYGSGHINDTFVVAYDQGGIPVRYIFQRINHSIFKDPVALMDNIVRVTSHQHAKNAGSESTRRAMTVINTIDGLPYHVDPEGEYWRVYVMIEKARTYDVLESAEQAFQAAKAFGEFQRRLVDLPGGRLTETIPDFHNTPKRFEHFQKALGEDSANRAILAKPEIDFFLSKVNMASKLLDLNAEGLIPERITHNDTKLNNVMIDDA
ncbi:MAG: aminoglycoside phosphotransferase family protein, partial [Kiritimatiellaeota bacterium]|nr:aminoglycoside phosphotransferase family protein [Kiritimatiellota bacterium]